MKRFYTESNYLDQLKNRIIVFDGAMGTSLQNLNLSPDDFGGINYNGCNDYLVITCPEAVETIHRSFLDVGVDVIETNTFRANRITLAEYQLQDRVKDINQQAALLAKSLAVDFSKNTSHQRFVAGSIGPSGKLPSLNDPELSNISFKELADVFREQSVGLIQGGVDLLLIETSQDILEVKAAINGIHQAFFETKVYLPIQVQVTLDTTGRMLMGTDISAVHAILEGLPIDAIGLNCSTGPDYMREPLAYLGNHSSLPVSCIPNAGLPINVDGQAVYPLEPEPFADTLVEFIDQFNVNIVGGCCGTTPDHLSTLIKKISGRLSSSRKVTETPYLASSTMAVSMLQNPRPFLIGEQLNTQGSKKFKQLILDDDYEQISSIARQQVENGAHGLDICVALTERSDEAETMRKVIKTLSPVVTAPFIIDSTEPDVIELALQNTPGKCLINSTNLEGGQEKADKILDLAARYNSAVILLTIDEQGMAKTAQRKLEIAKRLYGIAVNQHGLKPWDLVFDPLTFTLATGDPEFSDSAIETIKGIRIIKNALPGVLTSLGISNVSFGLNPPARASLNSVMLTHCVQAGLDMAIVNAAHIIPYPEIPTDERNLIEDLIYNRSEDALQKVIELYEANPRSLSKGDDQRQLLDQMTPEARIHWRILHRQKDDIENDIEEVFAKNAIETRHSAAINILNTILLPAMKEVGDRFGSGELILPFVLQSAEVMKKAVAYVEQFLEREEGVSKGTLVLATVYGDVHDIGKNLVKTILSNNGYAVIDLGKQVPAEIIISKAVEAKANAIGLSALLVSTSKQMPLIVNELNRRGLSIPVLIGGAAINRRFGRRILFTDAGNYYDPGVFYCKDAFEGLATMELLINEKDRLKLVGRNRAEAELEIATRETTNDLLPASPSRSNIKPPATIPTAPGYGPRTVRSMPLDTVFKHISKKELFRLSWGGKNKHGDEWKMLEAEFENRLEEMRRAALSDNWLQPQGIYGYWPAQSSDNNLIIYEPGTVESGSPEELLRFSFPRQIYGDYLCLADYFSPIGSGVMDIAAFQIVTVGKAASDRIQDLHNASNYSEAYYHHGLSVQVAEACAEYLHRHLRRELGLSKDQGKRYSWGYPAIPELSDHQLVFQLLPAESALGMQLTEAYQMVPEQSTVAIILHHPDAKYFNIGETRSDRLIKTLDKP